MKHSGMEQNVGVSVFLKVVFKCVCKLTKTILIVGLSCTFCFLYVKNIKAKKMTKNTHKFTN